MALPFGGFRDVAYGFYENFLGGRQKFFASLAKSVGHFRLG
jgi:hypothetical protein